MRALCALFLLGASACGTPIADADAEWPHYANDAGGTKY